MGNIIALNKYEGEIEKIISYLNTKTNRNFTTENTLTNRYIGKLLNSGYNVDDFKTVIDNKVSSWQDTDMAKYLRPSTLFNPVHFDEYLNETVKEECEEPLKTEQHYKILKDGDVLNVEPLTDMADKLDKDALVKLAVVDMRYEDLVFRFKAMDYKAYLLTLHWSIFRDEALKYAQYKCQLCGDDTSLLNVHHKTYENRGCETFNDVIVLCEECHAKFHDKLQHKNEYK